MSKKIIMLLGTIVGNCLVLMLYNFWPNIPAEVVQWAIGGISSAGVGGVLGQGFADGLSRGLTSHQGAKILGMQSEKNQSSPAESVR
ncbi:MAG: hypothetical protein A2Z86_07565 [Candidatus Glassbacteria bacterium GWA2_58_10]|uniref:Holin n=1 Tax=Candidatus Glassbacteria bacterium GWA2_58_10 TaxID=1817865 RepID=A0A1F5YGM2_9BACT|nr:MAG: hypothetical protein A2Z86_07565 [Candidatus Glassbacteria bacterium GWA2_58_10]